MSGTDFSKCIDEPRSIEELIRLALSETDEHKAWEPVTVLHFRGTREVLEAARKLCSSAIARERELGANVLSQLGVPERTFPQECFDCLARMLQEETNPAVLQSIATAFGHLHDQRCIDLLIPFKSHPDEDVRHGVVFGLLTSDDRRSIETLIELSRDTDNDVRDWATFGLGTQIDTDTPEIREALHQRLNDPDADTRAEAMVGLARRKDLSALEPILEGLSGDEVDDLVIEAAAELGDPRLLPALVELKSKWSETSGDIAYLEDAIASCTRREA